MELNMQMIPAKTDIHQFSFMGLELRAYQESGEYYFCAADACDALGYENARKAVADHCRAKGVTKRSTPTAGGRQRLTYISEGNLYRLIARSTMPAAEKFEEWVFDEVLPSLRKEGSYAIDKTKSRHQAAASYKVMSEVTKVARELIGKATAAHHYQNEARLVNVAVSGAWAGIDRDTLDKSDLDLLAALENYNSVLIARGVEFKVRKEMVKQYAIDFRSNVKKLAAA